jgi:hypothetical protein
MSAYENPWNMKNPSMSMWLSSANRVAGSAHRQASAEARREAATAMTKGINQMVSLWTDPSAEEEALS